MKVFIFEHVVGGGMAGEDLPPDLVRQGAAMHAAAVEDFALIGCQVGTTLDWRCAASGPEAVEATPVGAGDDMGAIFDAMAAAADAALVIAPETGGVLCRWLRRLEGLAVRNLGSSAQAVAVCADKLLLAQVLAQSRIATPLTSLSDAHRGRHGPVVIKPRDGAGCEDTMIVGPKDPWPLLSTDHEWIVQPWVPGRPASCSLLCGPGRITPLLAGWQEIQGSSRLRYAGGRLPLPPDLAGRAAALARRAIQAVPELNGFVGVDVVLGDRERDDIVIEINPRLTVSYVPLRRLCATSLAWAMLEPNAPIRWHDGQATFGPDGQPTPPGGSPLQA